MSPPVFGEMTIPVPIGSLEISGEKRAITFRDSCEFYAYPEIGTTLNIVGHLTTIPRCRRLSLTVDIWGGSFVQCPAKCTAAHPARKKNLTSTAPVSVNRTYHKLPVTVKARETSPPDWGPTGSHRNVEQMLSTVPYRGALGVAVDPVLGELGRAESQLADERLRDCSGD